MTVEDLHRELGQLIAEGHGERLVILSRDPEGNSFQRVADVAISRFHERNGESGIDALTPDLESAGYSEADVLAGPGVVPSVTLWP